MKTKENMNVFKKGDWILTTEIPPKIGQKYTNACVIKVKKNGALLDVQYGAWMNMATVKAKNCKLLKRA